MEPSKNESHFSDLDLFNAAVSYSMRQGKIRAKEDAMVEKSRLTDISYVLVSSQGRIVEQFPIAAIRKEAASLASPGPSKRSALRPLSTSTYSVTTTAAQSFRLLLIEQLRILGHGLIERLSISPSTRRTLRHWSFPVSILFLGAPAILLSSLDRGRQDTVSTPAAKPDNTWIPSGFQRWRDEDLAVRWGAEGSGPGCIGEQTCFRVEIVPKFGCNSLYVAASLLDAGGRNIGYTNDTTLGVRAGEIAVLTLGTYEKAMQSMRISKISCY